MTLFEASEKKRLARAAPLAVRMRPTTLDEFVGQEHFLGPGKLLRRMLEADRLNSAIFYGPAGTGKTTLATIIAHRTQAAFHTLQATAAGVKDVREVIERARGLLGATGQRTVLFIDELHRFNRAQQDVLLRDVEEGVILLIGATTENPFFAINSPLVSRSQIFQFRPLTEDHIRTLLRRALGDAPRGLGGYRATLTPEAEAFLATICDGDARRALTGLEIAVLSLAAEADEEEPIVVDQAVAEESIQRKAIEYDRTGDTHYDAASALIKSMRGSDPDATVYWLARMLEAGEDPRFIARRIAILASEDIGNADPQAIQVAAAAYAITERIGLPECQLTLAQAAIYMACAPKSNASATAIWTAAGDVREGRTRPVPVHLRDAHYRGARRLGHGEGYQYAHDFTDGMVAQDYLGVDTIYYRPTDRGHERTMAAYLERFRRLRAAADDSESGRERGASSTTSPDPGDADA